MRVRRGLEEEAWLLRCTTACDCVRARALTDARRCRARRPGAEIFDASLGGVTVAVDMYSFGIMLW